MKKLLKKRFVGPVNSVQDPLEVRIVLFSALSKHTLSLIENLSINKRLFLICKKRKGRKKALSWK